MIFCTDKFKYLPNIKSKNKNDYLKNNRFIMLLLITLVCM
jgi:hypothetical protein